MLVHVSPFAFFLNLFFGGVFLFGRGHAYGKSLAHSS